MLPTWRVSHRCRCRRMQDAREDSAKETAVLRTSTGQTSLDSSYVDYLIVMLLRAACYARLCGIPCPIFSSIPQYRALQPSALPNLRKWHTERLTNSLPCKAFSTSHGQAGLRHTRSKVCVPCLCAMPSDRGKFISTDPQRLLLAADCMLFSSTLVFIHVCLA